MHPGISLLINIQVCRFTELFVVKQWQNCGVWFLSTSQTRIMWEKVHQTKELPREK